MALIVLMNASVAYSLENVLYVNHDLSSRLCPHSIYIARDSSYKLRIPDLGTKLFIKDTEISPGITAHASFLEPSMGFLYIVSTRIRDDLPKDPSVLGRVAQKYQHYPDDVFTRKWSQGEFGRMFEFTLLNATELARKDDPPSMQYPFVIAYSGGPLDVIKSVGMHRFIVAEGYLYEFAVLLYTSKALQDKSKSEILTKASEWLDLSMKNFMPGKTSISCDAQ